VKIGPVDPEIALLNLRKETEGKALLYFICCYQQVLVNKDIQNILPGRQVCRAD